MRFSLTSLVRLIGYLAVGLSAVAIGVNRAVPRTPTTRMAAAPRFFGVGGAAFHPPRESDYILDAATGVLNAAPSVAQSLEMTACSPWVDSEGSYDLVGRLTDDGAGALRTLRLSDRSDLRQGDQLTPSVLVQLEPVLSGRPCWLPRWSGRLVIPAGDGQLYVLAYQADETSAGLSSSTTTASNTDTPARPLRWACTPPGDGLPMVSDPIAPDVEALGGRLVVTLSKARSEAGKPVYGRTELWWLEIDPERGLILDAGPLRESIKGDEARASILEDDHDERLANLAVRPDGSLVIAYLERARKESNWSLMVAPLSARLVSGVPRFVAGPTARIAPNVVVALPAISPDGRWVHAIDEALERARRWGVTAWDPPRS